MLVSFSAHERSLKWPPLRLATSTRKIQRLVIATYLRNCLIVPTSGGACVCGMGRAELKLRDLARESNNRFFAFNPKGRSESVFRPW